MDDELLDALNENPFHHHEKIMDSTPNNNEIEQNPNDDNYLTSSEIDDNLQQFSHSFSKQEIYEDGQFGCPLFIDEDPNSEFIFIDTSESNVSSIQFNNNAHRVCSFEPDEHFQ
jgi:basic membrane lipoprotein Med (substrate-binding protein (PBP1-ABC) superfamily)